MSDTNRAIDRLVKYVETLHQPNRVVMTCTRQGYCVERLADCDAAIKEITRVGPWDRKFLCTTLGVDVGAIMESCTQALIDQVCDWIPEPEKETADGS